MTSCWVCTKNLCFSSDALSREPAMLRRWAWILHLFILNRGNGLELAYNRGSCILLPRISLGCKLVAVTYQEYECAVWLVIVSLCNRTAEERIRENPVVCNKRDRVITCVFCQDLHLTLMFSALVQKDLFKGMLSLAESFFNWGEIIITLDLLRKFTNVRKWSLFFSKIAFVICASPIIHLVCPPKFCITLVF